MVSDVRLAAHPGVALVIKDESADPQDCLGADDVLVGQAVEVIPAVLDRLEALASDAGAGVCDIGQGHYRSSTGIWREALLALRRMASAAASPVSLGLP